MSTPVKRKITLELNPNKKVLPKDRPSVFQRLGTKKFPQPGGGAAASSSSSSSVVPSTGASGSVGQESTLNKEEIVKRIVGCDEPPEPVPPPKIVPESVSAHARLIEAQLAAKLGKVIVSRGETIGAPPAPVPPVRKPEAERKNDEVVRGGDRRVHSSSTAGDRERGGGAGSSSKGPSGGGGEGWDQSSLENAGNLEILERKRKELQHELKLEMDASGGGGGGGGGSGHHHHHHHSSSSSAALKQKKETLTVVKKVRKVPVPRRRSTSSSDSSSSSGSDSSDSDSSSSSSSSSRDSRRVKKRTIRQRRGSSSSSDGGPGTKKVIKKHVKKVSADGTKRIVTKKVGGHLTTKIRVRKVTSPGGTSHIRKVRDVSPGGKVPTKYTVKKVVAVQKKDKHAVVVDARERVREKEREMALLRKRELAMKEKVPRKSRSPRSHIRSRSPRSRLSPTTSSSRGREVLKKKSPEPPPRYREPPATVVRRPERSPERLDDRRRHESLKDRERRERQERELARNKEREEALARCQERQRERDRLAAAKERERGLPPQVASGSSSGSGVRGRDGDGGLEKPDRHRPVERLLPRPAERARALAAARSPGKIDHDRSRTPNSPRNRERGPRERSYDRGGPVERGYVDHHDRRSRSREREYSHPQTIVRGARARDSPYERHPAPTPPVRESRDYRDADRSVGGGGGGGGYERERGGRGGHEYGRNDYPDDPPPRREHDREWGDREPERGHPPPSRSFDRRGADEHGAWDRDHHPPPQHSHGPHDQEPYQGSSRSWGEESRWKEADGWVNEKERSDWKYKEQRQWEHDDHPAVGPGPGHTHTHGGGGRGGGRWQQGGHPEQNQGSNWHGKPKDDMDFAPRHKLAGRLGEVGDRGGMFRRHTHQGPGHQGPPMYHHERKVGGHMGGGGMGGPGGRGGGRFGPPNKYSINRTQQNLANQQLQQQQQHQHQHHQGPPSAPPQQQQQMGPGNQGPPLQPQHPPGPGQQQPCLPANLNAQPVITPAPALVAEGKEEVLPISEQQQAPVAAACPESAPVVAPAVENQPTQVIPPAVAPVATVTDDKTPVEGSAEGLDSAPEPTAAPVAAPTEAIVGEKPAEQAVAAEPMDEDNLSEISDDPDDILTREEEDDFGESDPSGPTSVAVSHLPSSSASLSSAMMIPSQVLQNHQFQHQQDSQNQQPQQLSSSTQSSSLPPRRPFLSKARYKSYDGCIGGPLPDLYANVDDGSFRIDRTVGEISQLNDAAAQAADKPSTSAGGAADAPSGEVPSVGGGGTQDASDSNAAPSSAEQSASLPQEPKDSKEAGKLQANKELKEEMDLDFEEISDGELEEENKFKGLGDALGVDWASLAQETRAKLKPEQTIPVSARNRWKAHHILLDIGISVRLAGESYAQRVLTESKEKLREEIQEFKAAAVAARQQKVAAVKREEEEQQLFNGVKIKKEVLDEDEQKEAAAKEQAVKQEAEAAAAADEATTEQEANLAEMDKILHPVASVHVAMRERARARRNLILRAAGPFSRALSARRDLEIRRQLCGFPPQECNERITEHQAAAAAASGGTTTGGGAANGTSDLHETVMKLFQATMQPNNKIEVQ